LKLRTSAATNVGWRPPRVPSDSGLNRVKPLLCAPEHSPLRGGCHVLVGGEGDARRHEVVEAVVVDPSVPFAVHFVLQGPVGRKEGSTTRSVRSDMRHDTAPWPKEANTFGSCRTGKGSIPCRVRLKDSWSARVRWQGSIPAGDQRAALRTPAPASEEGVSCGEFDALARHGSVSPESGVYGRRIT
jgi:hypothetical protein